MQGICGCSSIIFRFYSLEFISLADATVVCFSSPVFVIVLAHVFLKEKCSILSILVAFLTAVGVLIISRPPMFIKEVDPNSKLWLGVVLAVGMK